MRALYDFFIKEVPPVKLKQLVAYGPLVRTPLFSVEGLFVLKRSIGLACRDRGQRVRFSDRHGSNLRAGLSSEEDALVRRRVATVAPAQWCGSKTARGGEA